MPTCTGPDVMLDEVIAPSFYGVHRAIRDGHDENGVPKTHFWAKGGRGSTKSSCFSIEVVLQLKRHPKQNAVVMRKVAKTMRNSVYEQVKWAIDTLGVRSEFKLTTSPMEMVYRPTGQKIMFIGVDEPDKLKSLKCSTGYVGVLWFEELDQFAGMEEIRSIQQSLMRGGDRFTALYSYNPPKSRDSWVNREALTLTSDPSYLIHTSDYRDVPPAWLGPTFFEMAESLKAKSEAKYNHEYLGEVTGTGGAVFDNVTVRPITDVEVESFDHTYSGVDFGWFPDPWVYVRCHLDLGEKRRLFIFDEDSGTRIKATEQIARIKKHLSYLNTNPANARFADADGMLVLDETITCDSANPQNIAEYRDFELDARPVRKGPGSVEFGMKWLQELDEIIIDSERALLCSVEFPLYEHEKTRDGAYTSNYPDANNHGIDGVRYAVSDPINRRS